MIAENSWTFWEYLFYGAVIFVVSIIDLILDNWIPITIILFFWGVIVLIQRAHK
jgi:hypothetical protein